MSEEHASGLFLVLEGGEGSGKSTQVPLLASRLRAAGREVVTTSEPGGTRVGEGIRDLLLGGEVTLDSRAEALLIAADRAEHVAEVVRPSLAGGADVVSDRHVPSSLAYQGVGRGLGVEEIERLNHWATGGLVPDLVVILDVPDELARRRLSGPPDRLEREGQAFHAQVRAAYRDLAAGRGWVVVDGTGSPSEITERIWPHVAPLL